jgi:hypothetical protein
MIVTQLIKKLPTFYGIWGLIIVFKRTCHWTLPWARQIQSMSSHVLASQSFLTSPWQLKIVKEYLYGIYIRNMDVGFSLTMKTGTSNNIGRCNWTFCCVFSQDSFPLHTSLQFKEGGWLCRTNVENSVSISCFQQCMLLGLCLFFCWLCNVIL